MRQSFSDKTRSLVLSGDFAGDSQTLQEVDSLSEQLLHANLSDLSTLVEQVVSTLTKLPCVCRSSFIIHVLQPSPIFDRLIDAIYEWCFEETTTTGDDKEAAEVDWELVRLLEEEPEEAQDEEEKSRATGYKIGQRFHVLRAVIVAAPQLQSAAERLFLRYFSSKERFMREEFLHQVLKSRFVSDAAVLQALASYPASALPKIINAAGKTNGLRTNMIDTLVRKYHASGLGKLPMKLVVLGSDQIVEEFCLQDANASFSVLRWGDHSEVYRKYIEQQLQTLESDVLRKGLFVKGFFGDLSLNDAAFADFVYRLSVSQESARIGLASALDVQKELKLLSAKGEIQQPELWPQLESVLAEFVLLRGHHKLSINGWLFALTRLDPSKQGNTNVWLRQQCETSMIRFLLGSKKLLKDRRIKEAILLLMKNCCRSVSAESLNEAVQSGAMNTGEFGEDMDMIELCFTIYNGIVQNRGDHRLQFQVVLAWIELHQKLSSAWLQEHIHPSKLDSTWNSWFKSCTLHLFQRVEDLHSDIRHRISMITDGEAFQGKLVSFLGMVDLLMQQIHKALQWALAEQQLDLCSGWIKGSSVVSTWRGKLQLALQPQASDTIPNETFLLRHQVYVCPVISKDLYRIATELVNNLAPYNAAATFRTYSEVMELALWIVQQVFLASECLSASRMARIRSFHSVFRLGLDAFLKARCSMPKVACKRTSDGKVEVVVVEPLKEPANSCFWSLLLQLLSPKFEDNTSSYKAFLTDVWNDFVKLNGLVPLPPSDDSELKNWLKSRALRHLPKLLEGQYVDAVFQLLNQALTSPYSTSIETLFDFASLGINRSLLGKILRKYDMEPVCSRLQEFGIEILTSVEETIPFSTTFLRRWMEENNSPDVNQRMENYNLFLDAALRTRAQEFARCLHFVCGQIKNERGSSTREVYAFLCCGGSTREEAMLALSLETSATVAHAEAICRALMRLLKNDMSRRDSSAVMPFKHLSKALQNLICKHLVSSASVEREVGILKVWMQFCLQVDWTTTTFASGEKALPGVYWRCDRWHQPWISKEQLRKIAGQRLKGFHGEREILQLLLSSFRTTGDSCFQDSGTADVHALNLLLCESLQHVRKLHYEAKGDAAEEADGWLCEPLWHEGILESESAFKGFHKLISIHGESWMCVDSLQEVVRSTCAAVQLDLSQDSERFHRGLKLFRYLVKLHDLWFLHPLLVDLSESLCAVTLAQDTSLQARRRDFKFLLQCWRSAHKHGPLRKWFTETFLETSAEEEDFAVCLLSRVPLKSLYRASGVRALRKGESVRALLQISKSAFHLDFVQQFFQKVRQDKLMDFYPSEFPMPSIPGPFSNRRGDATEDSGISLGIFAAAGVKLTGEQASKVGAGLLTQLLDSTSIQETRSSFLEKYSCWPTVGYLQYIELYKMLAEGSGDPQNAALLETLTLNAFDHSDCLHILSFLLSPEMLKSRRNQRTAVSVLNRMPSKFAPDLVLHVFVHLLSPQRRKVVGVTLQKAILRLLSKYKDSEVAGRLLASEWETGKLREDVQEECLRLALQTVCSSSSGSWSFFQEIAWRILESTPDIVQNLTPTSLTLLFGSVELKMETRGVAVFEEINVSETKVNFLESFPAIDNEVVLAISKESTEVKQYLRGLYDSKTAKRQLTDEERLRWCRLFNNLRIGLQDLGTMEHIVFARLSLVGLIHVSPARFGLPDPSLMSLLERTILQRIEDVYRDSASLGFEAWRPRFFVADEIIVKAFARLSVLKLELCEQQGGEVKLDGEVVVKLRAVLKKMLETTLKLSLENAQRLAASGAMANMVTSIIHGAEALGKSWAELLFHEHFKSEFEVLKKAAALMRDCPVVAGNSQPRLRGRGRGRVRGSSSSRGRGRGRGRGARWRA